MIVGGNIEGHTETLASGMLEQFTFNNANDQYAVAIGLVLLALILLLIGTLTVIQQRTGGIQLRFREA